jgi:hypothetical protein
VIEGRARPRRSAVTILASLREPGLHMVGICRPLKIFKVTGDAGCVRNAVVVVDMALRALQRRVGAGQREPCRAVIESSVCPRSRVVARRACGRNSGRRMWRAVCALIVLGMA